MPQSTKQSQRQVATPSPTPGDILNTLLHVKDAVNSTLLSEHRRFTDLSNVLSEVENQVRDAFETTIKTLKAEIEKRKRKIVPGIKKLQDILKSLSKSEIKCKASDRGYKNAVAKKAKRRIKDTQKYLKEFIASDTELSTTTLVSDQITFLCQKLMHIPPTIGSSAAQIDAINTAQFDNSDSDSESSRSESRNNTPIDHIYNEIDTSQTSLTLKQINQEHKKIDSVNDDKDLRQTRRSPKNRRNVSRTNNRLNSVVLFSSDSESDVNDQKPTRHSRSADCVHSNSHGTSRNEVKYESNKISPDYEQLMKPELNDVFRNFTTQSNRTQNDRSTPKSIVVCDDYEKPIQTKRQEHLSPMPKSLELGSLSTVSPTKQTTTSPPKRQLPALPKVRPAENNISNQVPNQEKFASSKQPTLSGSSTLGMDCTDSSVFDNDTGFNNNNSLATNTVELLADAQTLLNDIQSSNEKQIMDSDTSSDDGNIKSAIKTLPQDKLEHTTLIEPDYVDMEEITFRASVRTARREILDRLKNKFSHNDKQLDNDKSQEQQSNCAVRFNTNLHKFDTFTASRTHKKCSEESHDEIVQTSSKRNITSFTHDAGSLPSCNDVGRQKYENNSQENKSTKGIYKSRMIHTYETKSPVRNLDHKLRAKVFDDSENNSKVSVAIQKFETANNTEAASIRSKRPKPVTKQGIYSKVRSTSEPRTSSYSSGTNKKTSTTYDGGEQTNTRYPNKALIPRINSIESDASVSEDASKTLTKSSTENDLLKLIENASSSSIRQQWSKRRSVSMTPKVNVAERKTSKFGPQYEAQSTIELPFHSTRCYISSIVSLQNDDLVFLDESHSYLYLYDCNFKQRDRYILLDTPKGCAKVNEYTVAVSFPYKKCVCTYNITMGAIISDREINVPCSKWIVDIAYSKDMLYVLCKDGDIHIISNDGAERNKVSLGMSGRLFIPSFSNRIFVMGENKINKFNSEGMLLTSKSGVDAHSMIVIENKIYIADRQIQRIVPLVNTADVLNLTANKLEYPLAMCCSINGKYLFVSQFEESMDATLTRTIQVLKLKRT